MKGKKIIISLILISFFILLSYYYKSTYSSNDIEAINMNKKYVYPLGEIVSIKATTDGVLVIGYEDESEEYIGGIEIGDNIVDIKIQNSIKSIFYEDNKNNLIVYRIYTELNSVFVDNENIVETNCYIHGFPGRVIEKDGKIQVVWEDSVYAYVITGDTKLKDDLIRMAEETDIAQESN